MPRWAPLIVLVAVLLAGCLRACCTAPQPTAEQTHNAVAPLTIELLAFPSCHNLAAMRMSLHDALETIGARWAVHEVNQEALPETDPRRGWPSPTILVNGQDLFGMAPSPGRSTGCRTYPDGVPDAASIAALLRSWR